MKTRHDFVSNSSSCSFIVEDPEMFYSKIVELFGTDIDIFDTCFFNNINICVYVDESQRSILSKMTGIDESMIWTWDGECSVNVSFDMFKKLVYNEKLKVKHIQFECNDYKQEAVTNLSILKKACDKLGIKTDSSSSEQDLLFDADEHEPMNVYAKLASIAFS